MLGEQLEATLETIQQVVQNDQSLEPETANLADGVLPNSTKDKRVSVQRIVQNLPIVIQPSNASQRKLEHIDGFCKNVSVSGCGVVSDFAPRVGDIYRISVPSQQEHVLNGIHARCVRCHMLDEEAFECGFSFMSALSENQLQQRPATTATNDVLV